MFLTAKLRIVAEYSKFLEHSVCFCDKRHEISQIITICACGKYRFPPCYYVSLSLLEHYSITKLRG